MPASEHPAAAPAAADEFRAALTKVEGPARWLRRALILGALAVLLSASFAWHVAHKPRPPSRFATAPVDVGDIVVNAQATGTVQPLSQVNVSAQVNGLVVKVNVKVNATVKKGDVLAEIDPSVYGAQASQVSANLAAAEAQAVSARATQDTAKLQFERTKALCAQNLASQADLEAARGQLEVARAGAAAARAAAGAVRAQLSQTLTNVRYTKIISPVDGVVISRAVDPGSTVVASFQAPVLFVIAQDLKDMLVLADVDEADLARVHEGQVAEILVDAYPNDVFSGKVTTLSYGPTNTSGIVTYTAYINVANASEKLRPGMTANVSIRSSEARHVVRVPNAALRYQPSGPGGHGPGEGKLAKGQGRVRVVPPNATGDEAQIVTVTLGISDGANTEVKGGSLTPGMRVAIGDAPGGGAAKSKGLF
jgi:HlyD family secretion protein